MRHLIRRKPKSAGLGRPRTREKKIAATTNPRSNRTSLISATAGVGWARLPPLTDAIAPTIALANIPTPNPSAIAAGAVQIGHLHVAAAGGGRRGRHGLGRGALIRGVGRWRGRDHLTGSG